VRTVAAAALEAGRPNPTSSVMLTHVVSCAAGEIEENERRLCEQYGLEPGSARPVPLRPCRPPERMVDLLEERAERLGLASVILPGSNDVEASRSQCSRSEGLTPSTTHREAHRSRSVAIPTTGPPMSIPTSGASKIGVTEAEHPTVSRSEPVPLAVGRRRHCNHAPTQ